MLLSFSIEVAKWPPLWGRVIQSIDWAILSFCVCTSFSFGFESMMWDSIILLPCLGLYFTLSRIRCIPNHPLLGRFLQKNRFYNFLTQSSYRSVQSLENQLDIAPK